ASPPILSAQKKRPANRPGASLRSQIPALLLHFILRINHIVILLPPTASRPRGGAVTGSGARLARGRALRGRGLVHFLGQLVRHLREVLHRLLDAVAFVALERLAEIREGAFDLPADVARNLLAVVLQGLFRLVGQRLALV